jgi:hypothetical protein
MAPDEARREDVRAWLQKAARLEAAVIRAKAGIQPFWTNLAARLQGGGNTGDSHLLGWAEGHGHLG